VIVNLGECVETVLGQNHFIPGLAQEQLGTTPDGVAVIDDEYLHRRRRRIAHSHFRSI
jgi:hypothetical protein